MNDTTKRSGGCLCGAVRYEIVGPVRDVVSCHCSQCRRFSGHQFATAATRKKYLRMVADGSLAWYVSSDKARRGFCRECGSSLFWEGIGRDSINVMAGTLDQPTGLKVICHIYVADKADYYELPADGARRVADGSHGLAVPD